jgi:hypothetical protein
MLKTAGANRAQTGGSIDNTPIGATTPSTGAFTSLSASGDILWGSTSKGRVSHDTTNLYVDNVALGATFFRTNGTTIIGTWQASGLAVAGALSATGVVTFSNYGAGSAVFSTAGVISSVSDETWKTKDGIPTDPDAMLKKLEPGYWYYNDEKKETFGADRQLGFYAQNVNAAIGPEAAPEPEEGKPWGYYDRSVLAITVMSLQKALATIESLKSRITALESK